MDKPMNEYAADAPRVLRDFLEAILHCTDTFIAVARFEGAVETAVASRYIRLCYISAKFRLHPRRERACPFRSPWFCQ